jgi:hypothetical protein
VEAPPYEGRCTYLPDVSTKLAEKPWSRQRNREHRVSSSRNNSTLSSNSPWEVDPPDYAPNGSGAGFGGRTSDGDPDFWSTQRYETNTIKNVNAEKAVQLIREKITEKFDGRPGWIRRAFVAFDSDGSGAIDRDEFRDELRVKTGLQFDRKLMPKIWKLLDDDGNGYIDFRKVRFLFRIYASNIFVPRYPF